MKRKINIVNTKDFFCRDGIPITSKDLIISGKEKNKYEILKRKTEKLLRLFDML